MKTWRRASTTILETAAVLLTALALGTSAVAEEAAKGARIHGDVPAPIDASAHYLFYLHGRILELQGRNAVSPDFGKYEYDAILQAFADRGFVVISEVREGDAGPPFVQKVAGQVRRLLGAGVPPGNVTVVGASKGGFLTLRVAMELAAPKVSFVILAGCGTDAEPLGPRLRGRILSIFDSTDRFKPSCEAAFRKATALEEHREVVLTMGLDHGLLYRPYKEWVEPASAWAWAR